METAASRRPILKKNVEAFVPSPRFLSESPFHGRHTSPSPSVQQLRSPVPPPPANLFGGNPSAFNVDPGVPFLGTAGPSDAGGSDNGSINEFEPPKRNVGGFVTGLKKALTVRRSQRTSPNYQQQEETYPPPMMFRDSGYATSDRLEEPLANQPPPLTTLSPSPPSNQHFPLTTSSDYHQTTNDHGHDAPSIDSLVSAVTALVEYGPDYLRMGHPTTPPASDVSFNTYMARFQKFIHDLAGLPWMANDRVTVDYYPSAADRIHKLFHHRPYITWHSKDYNYPDSDSLDPNSADRDSLDIVISPHLLPHRRLRVPSHTSRTDINLDSEFPERTPFPYQPQSIPQTPDHRHVRYELEGVRPDVVEVEFPSPPHPSDPLPNPTEWLNPNRNTPLLYPPTSGQTPTVRYPEQSRPEWRGDINPKTPSAGRHSLSPGTLQPPNTSRTHGEDPRLRSRKANATFSTDRPDNSNQWWKSTPKPEYSRLRPEMASTSRLPKPGSSQQPISGSPSRPSHTTSRRPRHESTEEWEEDYVRERTGYVPFEFSENYYGNRYGAGIHGLLPPVGRAASSGTSIIAPSIKQPQPQYPKPALVTPPSRPGSL